LEIRPCSGQGTEHYGSRRPKETRKEVATRVSLSCVDFIEKASITGSRGRKERLLRSQIASKTRLITDGAESPELVKTLREESREDQRKGGREERALRRTLTQAGLHRKKSKGTANKICIIG